MIIVTIPVSHSRTVSGIHTATVMAIARSHSFPQL